MTIFLAFICAIVGMYSVLWCRMVGNYFQKDADFPSSFVNLKKKCGVLEWFCECVL